jgi:uncharacterized glyoxalase superfamily protein PhnB
MADLEMKLGWVIVYVEEPEAAVAFYERAFGLRRRFVVPRGEYGELDTGATALAFARYALGDGNFPGGVQRPDPATPPNVEIALVAEDLPAAYARAVEAGCTSLAQPASKPQGQDVAYVRDPFGTLVELATPLSPPG